jgi:hypothetical protein
MYILAKNGTCKLNPDLNLVEKIKNSLLNLKMIFFVGSSYPPNAIGFWEMLGNLAFLPNDTIIAVAGGVCDILYSYMPKKYELFEYHIKRKILLLGKIDNKTLDSYIKASDLIILPITSGGGSNLKTAQAITSGKKIVATEFAIRGYEEYKTLNHLKIAKTKEEFAKFINNSLQEKILVEPINELLWENTLKSLRKIFDNF